MGRGRLHREVRDGCVRKWVRFGFEDEDSNLINNRQNGRRRGRGGGQRTPGGGGHGQRDGGNRIDSRARGNAAQLLEKYKNMARDAQLSGDRVNTEYYLQFADHYFRVLADQRGRFEEQNRDRRGREDFDIDEDFGDEGDFRGDEQQQQQQHHQQQRAEEGRRDDARREDSRRGEGRRDERNGRDRGFNRNEEALRADAESAPEGTEPAPVVAEQRGDAEVEAPRPRRGRPRRVTSESEGAQAIEADRLPPSLGVAPAEGVIASEGEPVEAPKPRARRRRTADVEANAG